MEENRNTPYCNMIRERYQKMITDLCGTDKGVLSVLYKFENMTTNTKAKVTTGLSKGMVVFLMWLGLSAILVPLIMTFALSGNSWLIFSIIGIFAVGIIVANRALGNPVIRLFGKIKDKSFELYEKRDAVNEELALEKELRAFAGDRAELAVTRYLETVQEYASFYITSSNVAKMAGRLYTQLKWDRGVTTKSFTVTREAFGGITFQSMKINNLPSEEACAGLAYAMGQLILMQFRLDHPDDQCNIQIVDAYVVYTFTPKPKLKYEKFTDLV